MEREFYSGVSGVALGRLLSETGATAKMLADGSGVGRKQVTDLCTGQQTFCSLNVADKLIVTAHRRGYLPTSRVDDYLVVVPARAPGSAAKMAKDEWGAKCDFEEPVPDQWLKERVAELEAIRDIVLDSSGSYSP